MYIAFFLAVLVLSFFTNWAIAKLLKFKRADWFWSALLSVLFYLVAIGIALLVATIFASLPNWVVQAISAGLTFAAFLVLVRILHKADWLKIFIAALLFFAVLILFSFVWMSLAGGSKF